MVVDGNWGAQLACSASSFYVRASGKIFASLQWLHYHDIHTQQEDPGTEEEKTQSCEVAEKWNAQGSSFVPFIHGEGNARRPFRRSRQSSGPDAERTQTLPDKEGNADACNAGGQSAQERHANDDTQSKPLQDGNSAVSSKMAGFNLRPEEAAVLHSGDRLRSQRKKHV